LRFTIANGFACAYLIALIPDNLDGNFAHKAVDESHGSLHQLRLSTSRQIGTKTQKHIIGDVFDWVDRVQVLFVRQPDGAILGLGPDMKMFRVQHDLGHASGNPAGWLRLFHASTRSRQPMTQPFI